MRRVLVGGVGYRWARDASLGLLAAEALAASDLPEGVEAADLGYGAILAAQDLADADPPYSALVIVTARERGRVPGTIERSRAAADPPPEVLQEMVREAGAGIVDADHLVAICRFMGCLPPEVTVIDVEPFEAGPGAEPSDAGKALLPALVSAARETALEHLRVAV